MQGKTHIIGGAATGAAVGACLSLPFDQAVLLAFMAGLGGLVPDIDQASSTIAQGTGPIGWLISRKFRHRGILHTPFMYLFLNGLLYAAIQNPAANLYIFGLLIGELSHLMLDSMNRIGIMWLWPFTDRRFHFLSVHSGGRVDGIICGICSVLTLAFIFIGRI